MKPGFSLVSPRAEVKVILRMTDSVHSFYHFEDAEVLYWKNMGPCIIF
jgi:hypothetical protein